MDYVFFGQVTLKEIKRYLENKPYSLLNQSKLRDEILNSKYKRDLIICRKEDFGFKSDLKKDAKGEMKKNGNELIENVNNNNGGIEIESSDASFILPGGCSKKEIICFLKNRVFSLLNKTELRDDILNLKIKALLGKASEVKDKIYENNSCSETSQNCNLKDTIPHQKFGPMKNIFDEINEITPKNSPVYKQKYEICKEPIHGKMWKSVDISKSYFADSISQILILPMDEINGSQDSPVCEKMCPVKQISGNILRDKSNIQTTSGDNIEKYAGDYLFEIPYAQELTVKTWEIEDPILKNIIFNTGKEFCYPGKVVFRKRDQKREKKRRRALDILTARNTRKNARRKIFYEEENYVLHADREFKVTFSDKFVYFHY